MEQENRKKKIFTQTIIEINTCTLIDTSIYEIYAYAYEAKGERERERKLDRSRVEWKYMTRAPEL